MKTLLAIIICATLCSCINSSTAFAWRSISYQSTPEAGKDVQLEEKPGDATVNAEKTLTDAFKSDAKEDANNGK
jgi:hypothetical protein